MHTKPASWKFGMALLFPIRSSQITGCLIVKSWTMQPLRSTPITKASSLLRATPPLCSASGLPSSWGLHLDASLTIGTTGSHVPHESLDHVHATFMPAAAQAVSRCPLSLSGSRVRTPFLTTSGELSTPQQWFGFTRLREPYLTRSYAGPFP